MYFYISFVDINNLMKKRPTWQEVQQMLNQTFKKNQQLLSKMDSTLVASNQAKNQLEAQGQSIKKWKNDFKQAIQALGSQMVIKDVNPLKKDPLCTRQIQYPTKKPLTEVIKILRKYQKIGILTGAGVSKASGIPTFRGTNGLYNKKIMHKNKQYDPNEFITYSLFKKQPQALWKWNNGFLQLVKSKKSNKNHQLIQIICKKLSQKGKKNHLITTNIDGFHLQFPANDTKIYEIHGNVHYFICQMCKQKNLIQQLNETKPICKICKTNQHVRPNIMFFDEKYGDIFGKQANQQKFQCVIVIGSSLQTGLSAKLVSNAEQVIEINPECVIEVGKVYQFEQTCEEFLPKFIEQLDIL